MSKGILCVSKHVSDVLSDVRRVCAQTQSGPAYCHARETALSLHTVTGAPAHQHVKQVLSLHYGET